MRSQKTDACFITGASRKSKPEAPTEKRQGQRQWERESSVWSWEEETEW